MADLQHLQIQQGHGLGSFLLGASIHDILARIKSSPLIYPSISISHSQSYPLLAPIILILSANGLRLRFDGAEQRLRLIEVLDFSKTRLSYKGHDITNSLSLNETNAGETRAAEPRLRTGPGFRQVYKVFGPTTPGEYIGPKDEAEPNGIYVLSYPGIAFSFPLRSGLWNSSTTWATTVSMLSSNASTASTALSIFGGQSWDAARESLFDTDMSHLLRSPIAAGVKRETVPREVEVVKIHVQGRLELVRKDQPSSWIVLGQSTPQDLITELGPPDAMHRRKDGRVAIHRDRKNSSSTNSRRGSSNVSMSPPVHKPQLSGDESPLEDTDESDLEGDNALDVKERDIGDQVFYNYYSHGFDILVSTPLAGSAWPSKSGNDSNISESVPPRSYLVATKILLHGNVPGSWSFNRHRRIRWTLDLVDSDSAMDAVHSEAAFQSIQPFLQQYFRDHYASEEEQRVASLPMVVNRALGREELAEDVDHGVLGSWEDGGTSSVRRLDQKTAESERIGGAEVYGFPGLVFEVLKNGAISCLMVY